MKRFIQIFIATHLFYLIPCTFAEDIQNWSIEKVNYMKNETFKWNIIITSRKGNKSNINLSPKGKITLWKGKECFVYPELQPKNHNLYKSKTQIFKLLKCKNTKKEGKESINYLLTMCDIEKKSKKIIMSMGKPNTPTSVFIDCQ